VLRVKFVVRLANPFTHRLEKMALGMNGEWLASRSGGPSENVGLRALPTRKQKKENDPRMGGRWLKDAALGIRRN
jgi:hypothetical protein